MNPTSGRRIMVGVVPTGIQEAVIKSGTSGVRVKVSHGMFVHHDSVSAPPDQMILQHERRH
jgi:hypothetical protein